MSLLQTRQPGRPSGRSDDLRAYTARVVNEIINMAAPLPIGDIEGALNIGRPATSRPSTSGRHTGEYLRRYRSGQSGMASAAALHRLCVAAVALGWLTAQTLRDVESSFPALKGKAKTDPDRVRQALRRIESRYREMLLPVCSGLLRTAARHHGRAELDFLLRDMGYRDPKSLKKMSTEQLSAMIGLLSQSLADRASAAVKAMRLERRGVMPRIQF